jgi:Flp pilus assembly protein CpaB
MKTSKLSFIAVIILAIIAGFASYSYLSSAKTVIYLFADDYSAGTPIEPEMLMPTQIDTSVVYEAASRGEALYVTSSNVEEVLGDYLRTDVLAGTPLMSVHSDQIGGSGAEIRLEDDMVAVSMHADNFTVGNPFISVGSTVNVYTSYQIDEESITELKFQNIRVLDVLYAEKMNESSGSPTISGVTLEMTPEQSVELQHAVEFGSVRLALVKGGYYIEQEVPAYRMHNVIPADEVIDVELNDAEGNENTDTSGE